jgi:hypothetical protein
MINKSKLMLIGTVTALLVSGASLGLAQTAPTTGGVFDLYRLPDGAPAYKPLPNIQAATTKHHASAKLRHGYSAYARITDYSAVAPSSVGRPDPFGVNEWFNR